jgi:sulfofructose kinase
MSTIGVPLPAVARFDVVGVGVNAVDHLCTVDHFPVFNSKSALADYDCQPGGQVATALVALQRWGCRTAYAGTFGDDAPGEFSRRSLVDEGVNVDDAVVRSGVANQLAVILVDRASGERTILMRRPPALMLLPQEVREDLVTAARVLHLDGYDAAAALQAADWARSAGVPVVVDVDMRVPDVEYLLTRADAVIVSAEFARHLTAADDPDLALRRLAGDTGAALVAVTLGAEGVVAQIGPHRLRVPAYPVACVDATGAGDVFHAGVIYGMLHDWELERTLRFANAAAGLKCTRPGGRPGIPTVAAAERLAATSSA